MVKAIPTFVIIFLVILIGFFFISKNTLNNPKVNVQNISVQLEKQFDDPEIIKAAINYAQIINEAILNPEDAVAIQPRMAKSLSCLNAVLDELKLSTETETYPAYATSKSVGGKKIEDLDNKSLMIQKIRDISVTNNEQRVKNYIKFNNNLSGTVFEISAPKISDCK